MTVQKHSEHNILKKVLTSLLIFVLSFSLISVAFSAVIFRVLFTRKDNAPLWERTYDISLSADYPREELRFFSGENRLAGVLYAAEDPKALVVIAPGYGADCDSHLTEALAFVDKGFSVFSYDPTGVRNSEGNGTVGLSQAKLDLQAALVYVGNDDSLSALPVLLYGHSAGGYAALTAGPDFPAVKGIFSVCPFNSPVETMYHTARGYVGAAANLGYPFLTLENRLRFGENADEKAVDAINAASMPIATIEGENDETLAENLRLSAHLDDITNDRFSLLVTDAPGRSGHNTVWLSREAVAYRESYEKARGEATDPAAAPLPDAVKANETDSEYLRTVLAFFDNALS